MFCCPRMWCAISVHLWPIELLLRLFARDGIAVAPAVYEEQLRTLKELYTDLTDATDFSGKATRVFRVHPCTQTTMTDVVIKAEALGKRYTISHQIERGRDLALRHSPFSTGRGLGARGREFRDPARRGGMGIRTAPVCVTPLRE